ncbi:hypothetical protein ACHM2L_06760 [Clostridium perfringens]|uniref:hypothetical protein n=1 Tax=Clostridium perfringens TaxID=1502 RepID=UPI00214970B1|nr:hypothetical protein [Clostridium perfringens]MDM0818955.1 hypothetical protein [Clostridium perfringens]UUR81530.1 hypothetical protein NQ196_02645 [Clostridium perfringens]
MEIVKLIKENDVISFDIFDTLIKRSLNKPTDLFKLVEEEYYKKYDKKISFANDRVNSERIARRKTNLEEVSLADIYESFPSSYTKNQKDILKKMEIDYEKLVCRKNNEVYPIFKLAIENNKEIIIVTDMYLPKDIIEEILILNDLNGYEELFVSCNEKVTKYSGNMYGKLLESDFLKGKKILHIGDNIVADIANAKKYGLNTFHIKGSGEGSLRKKILNKLDIQSKEGIYEILLKNFIKNNITNNDFFYKWGYKCLGPMLYGFIKNIEQKSTELGLEHIYFFARDGYLLKEAYNTYYNSDKKIENSYIYVSRKALVIPTFNEDDSLIFILKKLGIKNNITINSFLSRITNNIDKYKKYVFDEGLKLNDVINIDNEYKVLENLYFKIKNELFKEINENRLLVKEYLIQEGFGKYNNVGIMDLGWRGSLQNSLNKFLNLSNLDVNVYGFYLGLTEAFYKFKDHNMIGQGYLFMKDNKLNENKILGSIGLVELLFTAPHGTTLGYKLNDDGNISPVLDEIEYDNVQEEKIRRIQLGALTFIKDFSNKFGESLSIDQNTLNKNFLQSIARPTIEETNLFGEFLFDDFGKTYLAKPKKIYKYITNPKYGINDFRTSPWKIGYMKRLLRVNLNYFGIYNFLKEIESKKEEK